MPRAAPPYHHGDLRLALVREAAKLVETEGVEAMTLRELARRLGVSHAAPGHHFADKATLLAELAAEGFEELTGELRETGRRARTPEAKLRETGRAYVRFAQRMPGHYRVMFGRGLGAAARSPRLAEAGGAAFQALRDAVAAALPPAVARVPERVSEAAFLAWSGTHGAAMLILDGDLLTDVVPARDAKAIDDLVDSLTESLAAAIARGKTK